MAFFISHSLKEIFCSRLAFLEVVVLLVAKISERDSKSKLEENRI
jgi:hypothetical protein